MMRMVEHVQDDGSLNAMLAIFHGAEEDIEVKLPQSENAWELIWESRLETPSEEPQRLDPNSTLKLGPTSIALLKPASDPTAGSHSG